MSAQPPRRPLRSPRTYIRAAFTVLIAAATLYVASRVLPGLVVEAWWHAVAAAVLISLVNALIWPMFIRIALPITVLTLGLAGILLNGVVVWGALNVTDGVYADSFWTSLVVAILLTVTNTVVTSVLGIDDDDFYYRNVIRRQARRRADARLDVDVPGILFLEIDGLAEPVLRRAIRDGNVPELARWLREGTHRLERWECDWSSQTSASQAGILHGSNADIPAFRWYEKERSALMVSNHPAGAAEIERRQSNGRGLLVGGGASRGNLLTGDAEHSSFTIAGLHARPTRGGDYFAYFANPYSVVRTLVLGIVDIGRELLASGQQIHRDVVPRVRRGVRYALLRAVTVVILRDIAVQTVIADAYAGRPVVYSTFVGYDEVAHHSGIERFDTLEVLRGIDRAFGRIARAAATAPRPYRIVVLSDHGQSQGMTFADQHGETLEEVVRDACGVDVADLAFDEDEAWSRLGVVVSEVLAGRNRVVRAATRSRRSGGAIVIGPEHDLEADAAELAEDEVKVLASGSLGLIYIDGAPGRRTLEEINAAYPFLVHRLAAHAGIGFVLVRSAELGPLAIGRHGIHHLDSGRIDGIDPLAPYGPHAADHVRRTDGFPHCADIMVNAAFDPSTDEIGAFEGLVGHHGGLGGEQMHPFILFPTDLPWPDAPVVGAEHLHRVLIHWLDDLGHAEVRATRAAELAAGGAA